MRRTRLRRHPPASTWNATLVATPFSRLATLQVKIQHRAHKLIINRAARSTNAHVCSRRDARMANMPQRSQPIAPPHHAKSSRAAPRRRRLLRNGSAQACRRSRWCRPWARCMPGISRWCACAQTPRRPRHRLDLRQSGAVRAERGFPHLSAHLRGRHGGACAQLQADLVWAPPVETMYPAGLRHPHRAGRPGDGRPRRRVPAALFRRRGDRGREAFHPVRARHRACSARRITSSSRWSRGWRGTSI